MIMIREKVRLETSTKQLKHQGERERGREGERIGPQSPSKRGFVCPNQLIRIYHPM